jgi:hypothetical protein
MTATGSSPSSSCRVDSEGSRQVFTLRLRRSVDESTGIILIEAQPGRNIRIARQLPAPATVFSATVGGSQGEHSVRSGCVIHKERCFRTDVVLFVLV